MSVTVAATVVVAVAFVVVVVVVITACALCTPAMLCKADVSSSISPRVHMCLCPHKSSKTTDQEFDVALVNSSTCFGDI